MNFAHAEVATLDPTTMRTLCEEYIANNYIDPETSERLGVKRGPVSYTHLRAHETDS